MIQLVNGGIQADTWDDQSDFKGPLSTTLDKPPAKISPVISRNRSFFFYYSTAYSIKIARRII